MAHSLVERQAQIAERVRRNGFQTVNELAALFDVTTQTIRRDIAELNEKGVIRRRHGGVELPSGSVNIGFEERRILNFAAKDRIARQVAARIPDGASLAIGIGTTPFMVLRHLAAHRGLKLVTNNLQAASAACTLAEVEVQIAGGPVRPAEQYVAGPDVVPFFQRFKVDFGIYGVGGVDAGVHLLDFHSDEVAFRETIRENCRQAFLVLDAGKFGRPAFVRAGAIDDADAVFCDAELPAEARGALRRSGRDYVRCDEELAA